jgi:hypothetical protein
MPSTEDRLGVLERQLRRTRRAVGALAGVLVLASIAAAAPALVPLVCKELAVKDANGKTVVELTESGDVVAAGVLNGKNIEVTERIRVQGKDVQLANKAIKYSYAVVAITPSPKSGGGWGVNLGAKADSGTVVEELVFNSPPPGGVEHKSLRQRFGTKVIGAWVEPNFDEPAMRQSFTAAYFLRAGPGKQPGEVLLGGTVQPTGSKHSVVVHVLYKDEE